MKRSLAFAAALTVLALPALAEEFTVKMITDPDAEQAFSFEPAELTIQPGDTVTWVIVQDDMHNAVADAGPEGADLFESPMLEEAGQSWSYTFGEVQGTYSYHCHPHAAMGMKGIIVVGETSAPDEMEGAAGHGQHDDGAGHGDMKMKDPDADKKEHGDHQGHY